MTGLHFTDVSGENIGLPNAEAQDRVTCRTNAITYKVDDGGVHLSHKILGSSWKLASA